MAKAIRPRAWWAAAPSRPRMPKVRRRFAAVLAMAVSSRLTRLAASAGRKGAQRQVQDRVGEGAGDADADEPGELPRPARPAAPCRTGRPGRAWQRVVAQERDLDRAAGQAVADAGDTPQVGEGGADDVNAGIGVVNPVNGDFVDTQPGALGEDEQLGVEEPRRRPAGAAESVTARSAGSP